MSRVPYNHKAIEKKWRENWEKNPVNPKTDENGNKKEKYYCLDMFPYPSGNGLHVGHWRGYVISDVWSRYKLQQGYYIIHPMGWDAFGLPAENYAIKMGVHPAVSTAENIKHIKEQINQIAALYDWDREVNTTDPDYYKWTQWIFVKMFKEGLAYEKEFPINWCPSCKTGLANEEVVNGKCERCGAEVTKKNLRQWMLKITAYAERLLNDLDKLDWPEKVKKMQTDWIGKSYGAEVDFPIENREEKITVYTTRPDTLHGATFMVLAPESEWVEKLTSPEQKAAVEEYLAAYNNAEGLNLTTPLSSNTIFLQNLRKVFEKEDLGTHLDPAKLPPAKYPLTRLVMACPLWQYYVKPDEQEAESILRMLEYFWLDHDAQKMPVEYIDERYKFDNLYYVYNILAIRRSLFIEYDIRTDIGIKLDAPTNPRKLNTKSMRDTATQAVKIGFSALQRVSDSADGDDDIAKRFLNLLYLPCPSREKLWNNASASSKQALRGYLEERPSRVRSSRS